MQSSKYLQCFVAIISSCVCVNAVSAANVQIEEYFFGVAAGNGSQAAFGPNLTQATFPYSEELQSIQSPSHSISSFDLSYTNRSALQIEIHSQLSVGRAEFGELVTANVVSSVEIRPSKSIIVDMNGEMSFDLPPANMTANMLLAIVNLDTQSTVVGGSIQPSGASFQGSPDSGTTVGTFNEVLLEPNNLYRLIFSIDMFAFTDSIGPIGDAAGVALFDIRYVPEPNVALLILIAASFVSKRYRRS